MYSAVAIVVEVGMRGGEIVPTFSGRLRPNGMIVYRLSSLRPVPRGGKRGVFLARDEPGHDAPLSRGAQRPSVAAACGPFSEATTDGMQHKPTL